MPPPATGARVRNELDEAIAADHVREMFNSIAPSYDRLNHLLSFGLDRVWWKRTARAFANILAKPESRVLDICCGTGDQTAALLVARPSKGIPVTGLDFSAEMLNRARIKYADRAAEWVEGDAMELPYPDNSFDLVTSAFGFRNLTNYSAGLAEIFRVLKPGGQLGILEANQPDGFNGFLYNIYFHRILPVVGGVLSGHPAEYRYLPASVQRFPRPSDMLHLLRETGFNKPEWAGYLLQAAGLYRAAKPPAADLF